VEDKSEIFKRLGSLERHLISIDEKFKNLNDSVKPLKELPKTCITQKNNLKWVSRFLLALYILIISLIIGDVDLTSKLARLL